MKLVFLGTPAVAVPSLESLIEAGHSVPLVVSQPDRPVGRSRRPVPTPVKQAAQERGIEVFQPAKVRNAAFRETLAAARPDVLVVVAYGRILPARVLALGRLGAVNVHFSLLPAYRGAAPVQWALARAEERTGVTTMLMDAGLDEGDILMQEEVVIESGEHAPGLAARMSRIGARLLIPTLEGLESGRLEARPQDADKATFAPILSRRDGAIGLDLHAREIEGRVRGFDPWPGVWLRNKNRRVRIVEARAVEQMEPIPGETPGTLGPATSEGVWMACAGGTRLLIERVQIEGGRVMPARDAVNGRRLQPGDRLEPEERAT